ncbi:MAG TPA: hypothetical protein VGP26_06710 [Actinophytocola sp.]|jgi:hypothetical protein|nr:hypothetical protein [Actinophytocola sp.]
MSLGLYSVPEVYHSSWIEMKPSVAMRYEVDRDNGLAILYFGHKEQYVLTLGKDNLDQLLSLGTAARDDLATAT